MKHPKMGTEKKAELVFIPSPGIGHLVSTVEIAKLLVAREARFSITVLIISFPNDSATQNYTYSPDPLGPIRFIHLPHPPLHDTPDGQIFLSNFVPSHKPLVKVAVEELLSRPDSGVLVAFVVDLFCTSMMDIATQLGVPSYLYFTSNAGFLSLIFHIQHLLDHHCLDAESFKNSDGELAAVPGFVNPMPHNALPRAFLDTEGWLSFSLSLARGWREAKGILINTFMELESTFINSFSNSTTNIPKVYPVGPILDLNIEGKGGDVITWLDQQPESSVVFLCFGSKGSFVEDQVREIAYGLERSGHRFLWSLRKPPPPDNNTQLTSEYNDFDQVLPEGFIERTARIGKVIGWAPQVAVLAHKAIGGFVTHCGWNSILESLWYGVPTATWPMYAEQQTNAFEMARELELAVELRLKYDKDNGDIVLAEDLERGISSLMKCDSDVRRKVKEMGLKGRQAMSEDGSSYTWLGHFIADVLANMP